MRRDFRQALTVIQAVAVLHQQQRRRDSEGRIIADLTDYQMGRELLLDAFTTAATGGVSKTVRETVEALKKLYDGQNPLTVKALGDDLGIAKDTAWHRVKRAMALGYISNQETRRGQPAKLVPGDGLPEEKAALPTLEELQLFMCGELPADNSTIQPEAKGQVAGESEGAVENAVESAFQPPFQPSLTVTSDSSAAAPLGPVERLNRNAAEEHTYEAEADRIYVFALARERDFPTLSLRPGVRIMAGGSAWKQFTARCSSEDLGRAIALLESESLDGADE